MKTFSFETLDAWNKARNLAIYTYEVTKSFPKDEQYGSSNLLIVYSPNRLIV